MPVINNTDIQDLFVGEDVGAAILRSGKFVYNRYDYRKFTWTGNYEAFEIPDWVDGFAIFMQAGGGGGDAGNGANNVGGWGGKAGNARVVEYVDIKRNWPNATHLYYRVGGGGNGGTDRGGNRGENGAESYISLANYYSAQLPSESSEYRPISSTVNTVAGGEGRASGGGDGQNAPSVTLKPREKRMTKSTTDAKSTGGKGGGYGNGNAGTWGAGGGGGHGGFFNSKGTGGKGGDGSIEIWMWGYYPPYQNSKVEHSVAGGYKVPVPSWATSYAYAIFGGGAGGMSGSTTQGGTGGDSGGTSLGYGSMTAGSVATFDVTIGAGGSGGTSEEPPSSGGMTRIITNVTTQSENGGVVNLNNVPEPTNGFGNGYNSITEKFAKFIKSTAGTPYRPCIGGAAGTEESVDGKKGTKGGGGGGGYINGNGGKGADGYVAIWFWEVDPSA